MSKAIKSLFVKGFSRAVLEPGMHNVFLIWTKSIGVNFYPWSYNELKKGSNGSIKYVTGETSGDKTPLVRRYQGHTANPMPPIGN
jgi:hypothetical protein